MLYIYSSCTLRVEVPVEPFHVEWFHSGTVPQWNGSTVTCTRRVELIYLYICDIYIDSSCTLRVQVLVEPFHRGTVPPWNRSTVDPFHLGTAPPWNRSTVEPFHRETIPQWNRSTVETFNLYHYIYITFFYCTDARVQSLSINSIDSDWPRTSVQ